MSRYIDADAFINQQRALYCKNCARRMGVKNGKLKEIYKIGEAACKACELNDALDDLDDQPTADVAPVIHARWNKNEERRTAACSLCTFMIRDDIGNIEEICRFCPNCGAKMDEQEDEK